MGRLDHGAIKGVGVISGVMNSRIMGPNDHLEQDQAQIMDRGEPYMVLDSNPNFAVPIICYTDEDLLK